MKNVLWLTMAAVVLSSGSLWAHHSYTDYDRNAPVTLEGEVKNVNWANPHITVQLQTADKGVYSVEFNAPSFMTRFGVTQTGFLKTGDRVTIQGSVNRNPEKKILTLVREVHRPADGWAWQHPSMQTAATK